MISKDILLQEMHSLQTSVSAASAWAQSWRGRFSPAKTVVLPLCNLATNACQQFPLSIDEENINIVDTHKHLGVILSTDLKWKAHLESILAKARKRAGLLRHVHVSHQLLAKLTCHLYITYVRPMMEYACPVWHSSASTVDALALERVQASVAHTILAADWDTPKDILLGQLKGEVRTINDRNICERRSCMKNNGKSPTFKFVSGEERRPSEVQRVSRDWRLPGATHSSADLTWIRK